MDGDTSVVLQLRTSDVAVLGARFNPHRNKIIQWFVRLYVEIIHEL